MASSTAVVTEIEEALIGHWSHFGRWPRGRLVEDAGTLRYETPIPQLPYNGVIRTDISGEAESVVARVLASFAERGVALVWWHHPTASPADLGTLLAARGLSVVERVTGMAIDLETRERSRPAVDGLRLVEVVDDHGMRDYADLIVDYWEVPEESRALVDEINRYWGPGSGLLHRWVAYADDKPVGKVLLSLAAPPGVGAIYGMSVRPAARGMGIASLLTETVLERAEELDCRKVVLHSSEMAVGVYRRAGFAPVCELTVYANAPLWASRHS